MTARWQAEIDAIIASLAGYLHEEVVLINVTDMDDAFSCLVRNPAPAATGFQITWQGVLGMEYIDGQPDISVSIFLYSRGNRIRLAEHRGSYLELVYEGRLDGRGTWRNLGWTEDVLGEFEAHDHYGDR